MAVITPDSSVGTRILNIKETDNQFIISPDLGRLPSADQQYRDALAVCMLRSTIDPEGANAMFEGILFESRYGKQIRLDVQPIVEFVNSDVSVEARRDFTRQNLGRLERINYTTNLARGDASAAAGSMEAYLVNLASTRYEAVTSMMNFFVRTECGIYPNWSNGSELNGRKPLDEAIHRTNITGGEYLRHLNWIKDGIDNVIGAYKGPSAIPVLTLTRDTLALDKRALAQGNWQEILVGGESDLGELYLNTVYGLLETTAFIKSAGKSAMPDFDFVLGLKTGFMKGRDNDTIARKAAKLKETKHAAVVKNAKEVLADPFMRLLELRGQTLIGESYPIAPSSIFIPTVDGEPVSLPVGIQDTLQSLRGELAGLTDGDKLRRAQIQAAIDAGESMVQIVTRLDDIWGNVDLKIQESMLATVGDREAVIEIATEERSLAIQDLDRLPRRSEQIAETKFSLTLGTTDLERIHIAAEALREMHHVLEVRVAGEMVEMTVNGADIVATLDDPNMPDSVKDMLASLIINTSLVGFPPREEMIDLMFSSLKPQERQALVELRAQVTADNRTTIISPDLMANDVYNSLLKRVLRSKLRATHPDSDSVKSATPLLKAAAKSSFALLSAVNTQVDSMRTRATRGRQTEDLFV